MTFPGTGRLAAVPRIAASPIPLPGRALLGQVTEGSAFPEEEDGGDFGFGIQGNRPVA